MNGCNVVATRDFMRGKPRPSEAEPRPTMRAWVKDLNEEEASWIFVTSMCDLRMELGSFYSKNRNAEREKELRELVETGADTLFKERYLVTFNEPRDTSARWRERGTGPLLARVVTGREE